MFLFAAGTGEAHACEGMRGGCDGEGCTATRERSEASNIFDALHLCWYYDTTPSSCAATVPHGAFLDVRLRVHGRVYTPVRIYVKPSCIMHVCRRARGNHAKNTFAGRFIPFSVLYLWDNTPGYALAPCHIAGIFRPLPGSRHSKLEKV